VNPSPPPQYSHLLQIIRFGVSAGVTLAPASSPRPRNRNRPHEKGALASAVAAPPTLAGIFWNSTPSLISNGVAVFAMGHVIDVIFYSEMLLFYLFVIDPIMHFVRRYDGFMPFCAVAASRFQHRLFAVFLF
jgi:hypothetical protein